MTDEIKKILPVTLEKDLQDDEIICPVCHGIGILKQDYRFGHDLTDAEPREFIVMVKGAYEPTTGYYHSGYGCWVKDLTSEYDDKNTGYGNEIVAWRFFPQPYQPKGE